MEKSEMVLPRGGVDAQMVKSPSRNDGFDRAVAQQMSSKSKSTGGNHGDSNC